MRPSLRLHPESRCAAVTCIDAEFERPRRNALQIAYVVTGRIGDLRLPPAAAPARADELWKHTCFEAFVWPASGRAYYEFNLSPSMQWALYHFDDYRSAMRILDVSAPRIEAQTSAERYEVKATLELPGDRPWRVKPAAVIEEKSGDRSYWARAHPPGRPDFHRAIGYGFVFPPAEGI